MQMFWSVVRLWVRVKRFYSSSVDLSEVPSVAGCSVQGCLAPGNTLICEMFREETEMKGYIISSPGIS